MSNRIKVDDPQLLRELLEETRSRTLERHGLRVTELLVEGEGDVEASMALARSESLTPEDKRSLEQRAALGDVVAGIAHQSRNIMTGVLSFSQIARRRNEEANLSELLEKIERESFRCVELLNQVLILARSREIASSTTLHPCSLQAVLVSACELLEPLFGANEISLESIQSGERLNVLGDPEALRDVFVNLLQNAADATPAGGRVRLSTNTVAGMLEVLVEDSGSGVAMAHRESIFSPSFTTKGIGKGTGLGLAVSQQVVLEHGGLVRVDDSELGGARFIVVLPPAQSSGSSE